jgi:hypothetical protein
MSRCCCGLTDEWGLPLECMRHQPEPLPYQPEEDETWTR